MSSSSFLPPSLFSFLLSLLFPLLLFSSSPISFSAAALPIYNTHTSSYNDKALPSSLPPHQNCIHQHLSALLQLKRGFNLSSSFTNLSSWNADNPDCCSWEGVKSNSFTGHVISLDLFGLCIRGLLNFKSLFQLGSLRRLQLSFNEFDGSPIPSGFAQLSNLTHLYLRSNQFYGQIPLDIFHLTRLVSLDLSYNYLSYLESSGSGMEEQLFGNLSGLRELFLDSANLSAMGSQWSRILSYALPNLHQLSLSAYSLSGPIHPSLSRLHFLTLLDLSYNHLSSPVPESISNLTSLTSLRLYDCGFHHKFPTSIFSLLKLQSLDISMNRLLRIYFPRFLKNSSTIEQLTMSGTELHGNLADILRNLKSLTSLEIRECNLAVGPIPQSQVNFSQLVSLDLSDNNIQGSIPSLIFTLTELRSLMLSSNLFSGVIGPGLFRNMKNLTALDLSFNNFQGSIPRDIFELTELGSLDLSSNNFGGVIGPGLFRNLKNLTILFISDNNFQGPIPRDIFELTELWSLDLSSNNFGGVMDLSLLKNFKNLRILDLSDNSLTVVDTESNLISTSFPQLSFLNMQSCNISKFPNMLRNQEMIDHLDLSRNKIFGKIPQWIWKVSNESMYYLNLSNNALEGLEGPFPYLSLTSMTVLDLSNNLLRGSPIIPPPSSLFFSLANNSLDGEVPFLICDSKFLEILDLSNNNFTGLIQCLGEISNGSFTVLNLHKNAFHGPLLQTFKVGCALETLDLSDNHLEGQMPKSLANCRMLTVLNLGNNQIQDEFPSQLKILSNLHILILRSNKFFGSIGQPWTNSEFFPQLQIIDLSFNNFSGRLLSNLFSAWKMMKDGGSPFEVLTSNISSDLYYQDKVFLVWKGMEIEFEKIITTRIMVDLSHNQFHGDIPTSIGELKALLVLNMSHNRFQGEIPPSLQNLRELESLDLSDNSLSGQIPWQLANLSSLGVLNLSQNHLIGRIPQDRHLDTFGNDSFLGNSGLCGQPLSRKCEEDAVATPPQAQSDSDDESELDFMWIAFGVGHGVGMGMFFWTLALWRRGRRAFFTFVDKILFSYFPFVKVFVM